jgi:hypothetical protein
MGYGTRFVCGGEFYDSGGPLAHYNHNENKVLTFISTSGCAIKVDFNSFETESQFDTLRVYNGPNLSSPLIGTYSGTLNPFSIQSTGNALTFQFISDNTITYAGWSASISCPTAPTPVITQNGNTLFSTPASSYQWYLNGNPIPGANSQSYIALQNGTYYVVVTDANGCIGISNSIVVTLTGIASSSSDEIQMMVMPNPFSNNITIYYALTKEENVELNIYNLLGEKLLTLVQQRQVAGVHYFILNNTSVNLNSGVYILKMKTSAGEINTRIVKVE